MAPIYINITIYNACNESSFHFALCSLHLLELGHMSRLVVVEETQYCVQVFRVDIVIFTSKQIFNYLFYCLGHESNVYYGIYFLSYLHPFQMSILKSFNMKIFCWGTQGWADSFSRCPPENPCWFGERREGRWYWGGWKCALSRNVTPSQHASRVACLLICFIFYV